MTVQLVVRVPDDVAAAIDDLVREGVFASRSDAVRAGLASMIDRRRRVAVGQAIADGYRRVPQTDDEISWPDAASAAMLAEEPWRATRAKATCGGPRPRTSAGPF